jgi:acetolactate synthase-1/2/3 large subunit
MTTEPAATLTASHTRPAAVDLSQQDNPQANHTEKPQPATRSAGHVIVDSLVAHGVERTYVVPGESFLDVLDGLHASDIETIVCRHEGGAAYMAEADGKMNQRPGVAMVTRGPGAANAHVGLHTAWQDSTPMLLFVGLIPFAHRDREAFQEFDIKAWFDTGAKRVMVLDHAERASEIVAEAVFAAMSGRPGPVVVGLPEDIIRQQIDPALHPAIPVATGGMSSTDAPHSRRRWQNPASRCSLPGAMTGPRQQRTSSPAGWNATRYRQLPNGGRRERCPSIHRPTWAP